MELRLFSFQLVGNWLKSIFIYPSAYKKNYTEIAVKFLFNKLKQFYDLSVCITFLVSHSKTFTCLHILNKTLLSTPYKYILNILSRGISYSAFSRKFTFVPSKQLFLLRFVFAAVPRLCVCRAEPDEDPVGDEQRRKHEPEHDSPLA